MRNSGGAVEDQNSSRQAQRKDCAFDVKEKNSDSWVGWLDLKPFILDSDKELVQALCSETLWKSFKNVTVRFAGVTLTSASIQIVGQDYGGNQEHKAEHR